MRKDESGKRPIRYPMTLLAYAGYHERDDIIDYLIQEGASKLSDVLLYNKSTNSF